MQVCCFIFVLFFEPVTKKEVPLSSVEKESKMLADKTHTQHCMLFLSKLDNSRKDEDYEDVFWLEAVCAVNGL